MDNCPKCGTPWKLVPEGVSKKTGKPYAAFYKCNSCGNGVTAGAKPNYPKQAQPSGQALALLEQMNKKLDRVLEILETSDVLPEEAKPDDLPF